MSDNVDQGFNDFTGPLTENMISDDPQPVLSGTANLGYLVNIYDNGTLIGFVVAGGEGTWTFKPTVPLADGQHTITVAEATLVGESDPTAPFTFNVVTHTSEAALLTVVDSSGTAIAAGMTTADTHPILSGHAEPGSDVHIHMSIDGKDLFWQGVQADASGNWTYQPELSQMGSYDFWVASVDQAGNVSRSDETFTLGYFDPGLLNISLDAVIDNVVGEYQSGIGPLTNGAVTDDAHPVLQGTATAGMQVDIYDNGQLLGSVIASAEGPWTYQPPQYSPLSEGTHSLSVTITTPAGETEPTSPFIIQVDTLPPSGSPDAMQDQNGNDIEPRTVTTDPQPTVVGHADPGSDVHVHVIDPSGHQLYWEGVVADDNGNWSYQPQPLTVSGEYTFTIALVDSAGNVSRPSASLTVDYENASTHLPTATSLLFNANNDHLDLGQSGTELSHDALNTLTIDETTMSIPTAESGITHHVSVMLLTHNIDHALLDNQAAHSAL